MDVYNEIQYLHNTHSSILLKTHEHESQAYSGKGFLTFSFPY